MKHECEQFFKSVLFYLRIYGWHLRWVPSSSEGYCWKTCKIIDVGVNNINKKQLIIHEVSHIRTARFCNQKHNPSFWREQEELMHHFLPNQKLERWQRILKQYSGNGFYRLCYI